MDRRVDWVGAALVTVGFVFITFALGEGSVAPAGWKTSYILALLLLGILFVVLFALFQHYLATRSTRPPLMRLSVWTRAHGKVAAMQLIAFFNWAAFMSWSIWCQLYYQNYQGLSPLQTMVRLLPMPIVGLLLNLIIGFAVERIDVLWLLGQSSSFLFCSCSY